MEYTAAQSPATTDEGWKADREEALNCPEFDLQSLADRVLDRWKSASISFSYGAMAYAQTALLILAVFLAGCDTVEPDTRPAFVLDGSKPFVIEFGRGSGLRGLDIVRVDQAGAVELSRIAGGQNVESASLRLSSADVITLVGLVNTNQLTGVGRTYSEPGVADGTQWVLWIEQSPSEKSIYFNNSFPSQITAFANGLDALLQKAGLNAVNWTAVPKQQGIDQQTALWGRIEPAR